MERPDLLATHVLPSGERVLSTHLLPLDPLPRSVAAARRFVRSHLPVLPSETADTALLLTSELVTNAVLHAGTQMDVSVVVAEDSVVVMVHDLDHMPPAADPYDLREGGWGLGLVKALAESSAMTSHPGDGKTAWFRVLRGECRYVPDAAAARGDQEATQS